MNAWIDGYNEGYAQAMKRDKYWIVIFSTVSFGLGYFIRWMI